MTCGALSDPPLPPRLQRDGVLVLIVVHRLLEQRHRSGLTLASGQAGPSFHGSPGKTETKGPAFWDPPSYHCTSARAGEYQSPFNTWARICRSECLLRFTAVSCYVGV
jgi:hypothetical protein